MRYVDIILPLPLEGVFTYSADDAMAARLQPGMRVRVPLGRSKTYMGIVMRLHNEKPSFQVRPIAGVPDGHPVLLPVQLQLWQWLADYYMSPLGEVLNAALPSALKAEEGYRPRMETYVTLAEPYRDEQALQAAMGMLRRAPAQLHTLQVLLEEQGARGEGRELTRLELMNAANATAATVRALIDRGLLMTYQREVGRLNRGGEPHPEHMHRLNAMQQDAYNQVLLQMMRHDVVLLHGVTSSGKTEVYMHLIDKTLREGRQVLYLLPEIALTVQMMERLRRVFGGRLGIYHSKYSDAERVEIWQKQLSPRPYDVILGARSAVFLPFQRLGLVVVDEEHETSFKQQDPAPRYHARSAAIVLARLCGAKVLLGTATPSVESYYNAQQGKYGLVTMATRYQGIELPEIRVVDVKDMQRRKMMQGPFSPSLLSAMRHALEQGKQAILFQNRRGFAPMVQCSECGWTPHCDHCDVSLTLHRSMNSLTCHYCGRAYVVPTVCPECGGTHLRERGYGTEKVEDQVRSLFPTARVARMDLDTTRSRNAYERIIGDFAAGRTQVLIGTQMVSKGLDFDRVAVVGILDADTMLNYPDFRAYEHAFMMLAQVSGRAGRKGDRGLVMLQTRNPDLPVIRQVVANDYATFYSELLEERRAFRYPPFYRLIYVCLRHAKDDVVEAASVEMGTRLRQWFGSRVLGPDKPGVARVKAMSLRKIVLKLENGIDLPKVREYLRLGTSELMKQRRYGALQVYFDVDPL